MLGFTKTSVFIFMICSACSLAQTPARSTGEVPNFEVASVRPSQTDRTRTKIAFTPDGFSAEKLPLLVLLCTAFRIEPDEFIGIPGWAMSSSYDIAAKVAAGDSPRWQNLDKRARGEVFQQLLAERFGLKFHHEERDLPVYALIVAKNGPRLTETKADAPTELANTDLYKGVPSGNILFASDGMTAHDISMSRFIDVLSDRSLGRPIVDKTGLKGSYSFHLQFSSEDGLKASPPANGADNDPTGPSIFTALPEQLGLKLRAEKDPMGVIVIDHLEQPSEN